MLNFGGGNHLRFVLGFFLQVHHFIHKTAHRIHHLLGGLCQLTNGRLARGQLQQTQNAALDLSEKKSTKTEAHHRRIRLSNQQRGFGVFSIFLGGRNF